MRARVQVDLAHLRLKPRALGNDEHASRLAAKKRLIKSYASRKPAGKAMPSDPALANPKFRATLAKTAGLRLREERS